jgi:WhiB family transcriptional regulator, redox-sensing transcriptional regulator
MTATGSATNWRSAAACLLADPDLFFPVSSVGPAERQIARAKTICGGCPVREKCLEFALRHELAYGIWGGTTPEDRQRDRRRKRRRGLGGQAEGRRLAAEGRRLAAEGRLAAYRRASQRSMQASSSSVSTGLVT